MKLLLWDRTGFWLFYKRLEQGTFQLPTDLEAHGWLDHGQLQMVCAFV